MLKITKPAADRVEIEFSGPLDAEMMRAGLEELLAVSEDIDDGTILYRIPEFTLPTMGAIGVEIEMLPKLFGLLGKFRRCAVLSDASWLRTAAEVEGALIRGLEIKAFALGEDAAAEAWLDAGG